MNGKTPTLISGVPNVAPSLATIRSHASASAERAGQHVAVGRADRRLAELADQREQPREALGRRVLVRRAGRRRRSPPRLPPAENTFSCVRGQHDAAHRVVVARALEGGDAARRAARRTARCACRAGRARSSRRPSLRPRSAPSRRRRPRHARGQRVPPSSSLKVGSATRLLFGGMSRHRRRPQARLRRQAQALHLHRRARAAARVDPRVRRSRSSRRTPRSGRRRRSPTGSSRAWASSASSASTSPRSTAARAATTTTSLVLAEEIVHAQVAAAWRWASPSTPTWRCRRSSRSAPRSRSRSGSCPAIKGEKILCLGITEPDAGLRRRRHQDARGARRRRVRHQRLEDVHHQRPPRRRDRARDEDRPRRRLRRLHALPRPDGRARRDPREEAARSSGMHASDTALLAFQDVRVPDTRGARPGRQGLLPHHVGAPGRAADRRRGLRRGRPALLRADARSTPRSARRSAADRQVPGHPPQVRRDGDEDRVGAPDGLHDRLALPERRVPGARDLDGQAPRVARSRSRSPTSASRSTAAPAT